VHELLVEAAWPYFERSLQDAYIETIVAAIQASSNKVDAIILAQASMAPAAEKLRAWPVPVLASPRPGVKAAIAAYRRAGNSNS
jgi:glutamate racemase